jgi:hypothetical protein
MYTKGQKKKKKKKKRKLPKAEDGRSFPKLLKGKEQRLCVSPWQLVNFLV